MIFGAIADYATAGALGKLTVVNVFDMIFVMAPAPSLALPRCSVALRLEAPTVRGVDRKVVLRIMNADGNPVVGPFALDIKFSARGPGYPLFAQLTLEISGIAIPGLGDYIVEIRDETGHLAGEIPFSIALTPPSLGGTPPLGSPAVG